MPLLRYASTANASNDETVSLADYCARMKQGRSAFTTCRRDLDRSTRESTSGANSSKRCGGPADGDRIDEWVMGQTTEFEGKRFKDVSGAIGIGRPRRSGRARGIDEERKEHRALLRRFKDALGEKVEEVRITNACAIPPCLVHGETTCRPECVG